MKLGPTDWWRWPLWSWRNLAVTCLGVALLLAGLGRAQVWSAGAGPATATPVTASSSDEAVGAAPAHTPAVTQTEPAGDPSAAPSPSATPTSPEGVALVFVRAWARPYDDPRAWRDALTAYTTARFAARLADADPSRVPATQVSPTARITTHTATTAEVRVPTDAGGVLIELTSSEGRWQVDDILPDESTTVAPLPGGG